MSKLNLRDTEATFQPTKVRKSTKDGFMSDHEKKLHKAFRRQRQASSRGRVWVENT